MFAQKGLKKFKMHVMTTILEEKCKIWGIKCTQSLHDMIVAHSEIHWLMRITKSNKKVHTFGMKLSTMAWIWVM